MRAATIEDLGRLVDLEQVHASDAFTRPQLSYLMTQANAVTLVAEEDHESGDPRIIGNTIVLFRRTQAVAHLYSLTVDPERRGLGLGKLLLAQAEKIAAARGLRRMRLEVRVDNEVAVGLYRQAGYLPIGTKAAYYSDGCDALSMAKELAEPGPS